jgi:hypothetical protein
MNHQMVIKVQWRKIMKRNKTMVEVNLTDKELKVLDEFSTKKGMSRDGVMRQALRIFQLVESLSDKGVIDLNEILKEHYNLLPKSLNSEDNSTDS